ncbi:MAG: dTMP kinase [Nitrospinota bacterium]|nr:dTMP kinase [Nitrospinota bacterium]
MFITFEGIEGCGKTTQIKLLCDRLSTAGANVVATHEPGGTFAGTEIRKIVLRSASGPMDPVTELLLFSAARSELVDSVILPALLQGKVVLCDRFYDSTTAYQGHARGVDMDVVDQVTKIATGGLTPDRTIILDLPVEEGLDRAMSRMMTQKNPEARFEEEGIRFHTLVRDGFLSIAAEEPERVRIVDGRGSVEQTHQLVIAQLKDILPLD